MSEVTLWANASPFRAKDLIWEHALFFGKKNACPGKTRSTGKRARAWRARDTRSGDMHTARHTCSNIERGATVRTGSWTGPPRWGERAPRNPVSKERTQGFAADPVYERAKCLPMLGEIKT